MAHLTVSTKKEKGKKKVKKTDATGPQIKTDFSAAPPLSSLNPSTFPGFFHSFLTISQEASSTGIIISKTSHHFLVVCDPRQQEALFAPTPPIGAPLYRG